MTRTEFALVLIFTSFICRSANGSGPASETIWKALHDAGANALRDGAYQRAAGLLKRAHQEAYELRKANPALLARSLESIAELAIEEGRYDDAERALRDELKLCDTEAVGIPDVQERKCATHDGMARVRLSQRKLVEAEEELRVSLSILETSEISDVVLTADRLNHLALIKLALRQFDEAEAHASQVLVLTENAGQEGLKTRIEAFDTLATLFHTLGGNEAAEETAQRGLALAKSALGEHHHLTGRLHHTLGEIADSLGQHHASIEHFHNAVTIRKARLPHGHPDADRSVKRLEVSTRARDNDNTDTHKAK